MAGIAFAKAHALGNGFLLVEEAALGKRGAGHTPASGTGSCACAVAAHLAGKTSRRVTVEVERGEMEVVWRDDGVVELTGPAEIVAEGVYDG